MMIDLDEDNIIFPLSNSIYVLRVNIIGYYPGEPCGTLTFQIK